MADMLIERSGTTLEIAFDRPAKKNAINDAMYRAIADALEEAERDSAIRAVLFRGEGELFTAGNDLADFAAVNAGEGHQGNRQVGRVLQSLAAVTKPLVAAVHGLAVGIGVTLLLHCDLVYVADDARLITPFVNLGLVPEAASSILLPAAIGHRRAFAMFALGEPLSGAEAAALGLANAALPAADVLPRARAAAALLATKAPTAVFETKRLMREVEAIRARIAEEGAIFDRQLRTAEAKEAFAAFAEKRAPDFSRVA